MNSLIISHPSYREGEDTKDITKDITKDRLNPPSPTKFRFSKTVFHKTKQNKTKGMEKRWKRKGKAHQR